MEEKLKSCPFCKGRAEVRNVSLFKMDYVDYKPYCTKCGAKIDNGVAMSKEEAIKAWNRRAAPPAEIDEKKLTKEILQILKERYGLEKGED